MSKPFRFDIAELFGIDARSLALFRIGLAAVLLIDLAIRAADLTAHYTDAGVLPRAAVLAIKAGAAILPHFWSGALWWQALLFAAAAACATALLLGYRTWWATLASWGLLMSLHARNPWVLNGGDTVLHLLLFWSLFIPLGSAWSLDCARQPQQPLKAGRVVSLGTAALLIQVACMYVFAALSKLSDPVWRSGEAVAAALQIDKMATRFGHVLGALPPELLAAVTHAVLWFELLGALLLFSPVATAPCRVVGIVAFVLLQVSFGMTLELGMFPWACAVAMISFVPAQCWKWPAGRSPVAIRAGRPWMSAASSWFSGSIAAALLGYILLSNVGELQGAPIGVPRHARWIGSTLKLKQQWRMFTGMKEKEDVWFVIPGRLASGAAVDLANHGNPVDFEKPAVASARIKNVRWAAFEKQVWLKRAGKLPMYLSIDLCRRWNARHDGPERLERLEIVAVVEPVAGGDRPQPERVPLISHACEADIR